MKIDEWFLVNDNFALVTKYLEYETHSFGAELAVIKTDIEGIWYKLIFVHFYQLYYTLYITCNGVSKPESIL